MKSYVSTSLLLLCVLTLTVLVVTDQTDKKTNEEKTDKAEEAADNVEVESSKEDLVNIIEQLRAITAIRETIRALLPPEDPHKSSKQEKKQDGEKNVGVEGESADNWMEQVMAPKWSKMPPSSGFNGIESTNQFFGSDKEDAEDWSDDKQEEEVNEEPERVLTPQEQEGKPIWMQI